MVCFKEINNRETSTANSQAIDNGSNQPGTKPRAAYNGSADVGWQELSRKSLLGMLGKALE